MSVSYFLYCVLTFLALLHQTHGQTCEPGLDYHCVNETAFEFCLDGSVVPNYPVQSCAPVYCYDGCDNMCVELNEVCVPAATPTTTVETSSITTESTAMPTSMTTDSNTELTTEDTTTIEITTTELTSTTTLTTTTEDTITTEATTTSMPSTTETITESTTEEFGTTGIMTTTTTLTTMTESTTAITTEEANTTERGTTELTTPTAATTTIATSTAPTDAPPTEAPFTCETAGEFQDLGNCSNFYLCIPLSSGDFVHIKFSCPDGSQFDSVTKKCSQNATCIGPSCNEFGFYCVSTSQVQFCYDSEPPSGDAFTCPANTYCSMDCQYPCWADIPCKVPTELPSTTTEPSLTPTMTLPWTTESPSTSTTALATSTVTFPPTTTEYPSTSTTALPTSTITSPPTTTISPSTSTTLPTSTVTIAPTTTAAPFVCLEAGRYPDPTNCSLYYLCTPKSSGGFYKLHFSCPASSLYNPNIKQCSSNFTCFNTDVGTSSSTESSVITSTSRPFSCEESGRFADPLDCKSYYVCSPKSSGGFYELHYQCPPMSAYNQNTRQCSTTSSVNCGIA